MKRQRHGAKMNCGVYTITNTVTGKQYIGSTKNFSNRFNSHLCALNGNKHHSVKLQRAWNKYGANAFEFKKLIICSKEHLLMFEQKVIDLYNAAKTGYNILVNAHSREGTPHNKNVIAKMKAFQRSNKKRYEWKGKFLCLAEIAELENVDRDLLIFRVTQSGWDLAKAIHTKKCERNKKYTAYGKTRTVKEWADVLEQPTANIYGWVRLYDNFEDVVDAAKKWTVNEVARSLGMDGNRFNARLKNGWDIGNALCQPNFYRYNKAK